MTEKYTWIVLTNPAPGRDKEFNEWYDRRHIDDLLNCPGIVSAQRFAIADQQRIEPPYPYQYAAVYEIETDDFSGFLKTLNELTGSDKMPISSALGEKRLGLFMKSIGERRLKS